MISTDFTHQSSQNILSVSALISCELESRPYSMIEYKLSYYIYKLPTFSQIKEKEIQNANNSSKAA